MESYGAILKKAREDKLLDIETVERDTTITRLYIEALENEEADAFPGEPYLIGFLRNYAEYLGVDSAEVIKLYHAKCIQESPVPEGLIVKHRPGWIIPTVIISSLLVAGILGFGIYHITKSVKEKQIENQKIIEQKAKSHQYTATLTGETKRVYKGDQIIVASGDGAGNVVVTVKDTLGKLTLEAPSGNQIIELSEERVLDTDGDGLNDIIIYLSDISATDETRGAEIRMLAKIENEAAGSIEEVSESEILSASSINASQKNIKQTFILEDTRAYPFTVSSTFRGACVFRYKVDRNDYIEDYFTSGDIVSVTASNGVRLWMSNINAMKIQITAGTSSYDLEVGKAGQVQAEDIRWVKEADGKYRLVVIELD